jgi:hypothetical protein
MTQLQQMVYQDAYKRLVDHDHYLAFDLSVLDLSIPGDKEIKEGGYEGAIETVFQQMCANGTAE